ncbi:MAG: hypothetical protein ABIK09_19630 [Pseudomonadota bacterium]
MRRMTVIALILGALGFVACDCGSMAPQADTAEEIHGTDATVETTDDAPTPATPPALRVVTFNTGTSLKPKGGAADRGYGAEAWEICDEWYGNGLSWLAIMDDARAWIAEVDPDVIVFQEVFDPNECVGIPEELWPGFVCESWTPGDPVVAQRLLSDAWQVMCNPVRTDKCAAVHRRIGSFRGCDGALCLEGMEGNPIDDCGSGVRIGRGVVDLVDGGVLTLVNVHGSSGYTDEDMACRVKQFAQVFVDNGSGAPAANGDWNLILGDFNVDPVVMAGLDPSADAVLEHVAAKEALHFITETSQDSPATYAGYVRIDHVISDAWSGACWHAGITPGHPAVTPAVSFDHHPAVCDVAGMR